MNADIAQRLTPEEQELKRKRAELTALEAELAQRELELTTLQAELRAFEIRYLRVVGSCYAELDKIEAEIAETLARLHPEDHTAQEHAAQTRKQARESAEDAGIAEASTARDSFQPSESLKKLYRGVARRLHPDLATNEADRTRRHRFMAEANNAYGEGDEARLQAILHEWESSPEWVEGEGVGAELVRIIRKIAQVGERLHTIQAEMARLQASELFQLKKKVEEAEAKGQDLLAAMAEHVQADIAQARTRLSEVRQGSSPA